MKKFIAIALLCVTGSVFAQDSTKRQLQLFSSERAILSNTTEPVGKGKMKFLVTHYFDDAGGTNGGLKNFFGLDNSQDVRIGFNIGLTNRLDFAIARAKSGHPFAQLRMEKNYELALKYQLLRQLENDPSHPIAVSIFFSNIISAMDTAKTLFYKFHDLGDRMSQCFQLIIAKKFGKVTVQLNPTVTIAGYLPSYDLQRTMFALGGVVRFPAGRRFNIIVDYIHPFRTDENEASFASRSIKFHDPLGIGVEILTSGHVFTLNFTNATQIQEARFIPYNIKRWGHGEFRWGFTVSRKFTLWRDKK
jgi:hypothetical protein